MSTKFYYGQQDYIAQLNAMDDVSAVGVQTALAATGGSGLIGNGGETLAVSLGALQLDDAAALRAYSGTRKAVYIGGYSGIAGWFLRDSVDTSSTDNGVTIIVAGGVRWKRAITSEVTIEQFGARPVPGFDNSNAINTAFIFGWANKIPVRAGAGVFEHASTLDMSRPGLAFRGAGKMNTVLKYTGGGRAADALGTHPNNGNFSFGLDLQDFTFEGNADTQDLLRIRINHPRLVNVNFREVSSTIGCALRIEGVILGMFDNVTCSTNLQLMVNRPLLALVLDSDPTDGRRASANTFVNLKTEGAQSDGIHLVAADENLFIGGTSENNPGTGVTCYPGTSCNTFQNMGFENSTGYADFYDRGKSNKLNNCYGKIGVYIDNGALYSTVDGGFFGKIEIAAGADFPTVENVRVRFFGPEGGLLNSSPTLSSRNVFDVAASAVIFAIKAPIPVVIGATPFTYTNNSGLFENVLHSGGSVTQLVFGRGGAVSTLPQSGGMWLLAPRDSLTWSYSSSSGMTVTRLPLGANYT